MAKDAMSKALRTMGPDDTFQVINFGSEASTLSSVPLHRTPQNVARALHYITNLQSEGGTEMLTGVRTALSGPTDPKRMRVVMFMTDGYIGNDEEVIHYIQDHIGNARLFSFGVGSSVNRYLLDSLSQVGRGAVEYVLPGDDPTFSVDRFYARIARPYLTNIELDWGSLPITEISPQLIPDLFVGQPLRILGRYDRSAQGTIIIRGEIGGKPVTIPVEVHLPEKEANNRVLELMWARGEVSRLERALYPNEPKEVVEEIKEIGLRYQIVTRYTSMVAVERDLIANPHPEDLRKALAAVHLPAGMSDASVFADVAANGSLSPDRFKPGDPEIIVHAPEDARRVIAVLPWGEVLECSWEENLDAWMARFLVPREAEEGLYRVRVFIEGRDGSIDSFTLFYKVDSSAPVMDFELGETSLSPGQTVDLRATPISSIYEGKVRNKEGILVSVRTDVKRAVVRVGKTQALLEHDPESESWIGAITLPADLPPGPITFELVVTDYAGNVHRTTLKEVIR